MLTVLCCRCVVCEDVDSTVTVLCVVGVLCARVLTVL